MTQSVSASTAGLIMIGMRWSDRLIGLVSTMILARLLAPEDFGVIAMASVVIGLIDVLLDMGVNVTLVQNRNATQEDYNAAWTLRLVQSTLASLLVFAVAHPAAGYFRDPRVAGVIQVLALSILLAGFENIGVVSFQKNMEFGREFHFFFIRRVIGFLVTICAAWMLHSYWALVAGTLAGRASGVALSYLVHPMRPRPGLARMKSMLSFSIWNLLRGIGGYLHENLHRLLVGRRETSAVMGAYSLGCEIASLPSNDLLAPLSRVLFPLFVEAKEDIVRLKHTLLLALSIQALVGIPASVGLALLANEIVLALLGEKWIAAVPFIQIMGAINIVAAINTSSGYMLLALGRARVTTFNVWLQILAFAALAALAMPRGGAMTITVLRLTVAALGLLTFLYLVKRELPSLRALDVLHSIWRPCIGSATMAMALLLLPVPDGTQPMVKLLLKIALGFTTFVASVLALWRLARCPAAAESYLLGKLRACYLLRRPPYGNRKI